MSWPFGARPGGRPAIEVAAGERVLAHAGEVGGTRDALYLPQRVLWEQVASADWDQEERTLTVVEVAPFGQPQPVHVVQLEEAGRLLQLVRERVTASIALQRHVAVRERRSVRILARQAPALRGEVSWFVEYDDGLDPADPQVDAAVQAALAQARTDLGV
ncbi:hypothetical protein ASE01_11805 [Nocardioides sp. Root190]|uniref:hypothetical protein n=1 Tax=Nocardioides sp. Root190 TaxID=1736488 RepID=UPI0006FEA2B8|nr:hypothetical protein [Nocardioides sp. Root190]KRB77395.1 hypothetical protein ASE01_11805 [Nocardioides sp. Root190]